MQLDFVLTGKWEEHVLFWSFRFGLFSTQVTQPNLDDPAIVVMNCFVSFFEMYWICLWNKWQSTAHKLGPTGWVFCETLITEYFYLIKVYFVNCDQTDIWLFWSTLYARSLHHRLAEGNACFFLWWSKTNQLSQPVKANCRWNGLDESTHRCLGMTGQKIAQQSPVRLPPLPVSFFLVVLLRTSLSMYHRNLQRTVL